MPNFCAVVGCSSRGNRDLNKFFRIPAIPARGSSQLAKLKTERRQKWIVALRRKDLTETKLKYATICDKHFITGRPAELRDFNHPDWVPSLLMGYKTKSNLASPIKRYNQIKVSPGAGGTIQGASPSTNIDRNDSLEDSYEEETYVSGAERTEKVNAKTQTETRVENGETQTDLRMVDIDSMSDVINVQTMEISDLKQKII